MKLRSQNYRTVPNSDSIRLGFTVVELLVSIGIVGLLVAILLPAVQSAREAARMTECKSRMRQMALAVQNYESTHRVIPRGVGERSISWMVAVLPYMDQASMYEGIIDAETPGSTYLNLVMNHRPLIFTCPSDPWPKEQSAAPSYGGNWGWSFSENYIINGTVADSNQDANGVLLFMQRGRFLQMKDIIDGVSNTAMISEILGADGTLKESRLRYPAPPYPQVESVEEMYDACTTATLPLPSNSRDWNLLRLKGIRWFLGGSENCMYSHVMPPGGRSCEEALAAVSMHNGGVQVAFVDGSVRFVSNSIDLNVWRSVGTRDGGEILSF